jgi:tetratricopeptide (TPR) repeat protein
MNKIQYFLLVSGFLIFGIKSILAVTNIQPATYLQPNVGAAKELQNNDVDKLLKAAFELYQQKKYDEALANCLKAAQLDPKDFRPRYYAGVVYMAQFKLKSASEEFAKAIELKPDNKENYLYKARADQMRGAKDEAIAACRKALEIDPSFAEAYLVIGDTLRDDEKRRGEADAAYRAAVKARPDLPEAVESLGERLLYSNKDEKGAEREFRKAMQLDPNRMAGRFALGRLLVEQNRLKEAREVWEGRTTDKDNTFPNFITLLERAEKLKQATEALAQKPDDPDTLLLMGNVVMDGDSWVVDGRQEKAIVYFRKALKIKPDFTAGQYAICKAYIQIADTYKEKNKNVDQELAKLRRMDSKLSKELEEYRKTYSGGLRAIPANLNH